ncbi:MAG: sensor histidine kinase [Kiritimatiellia bacterium]
MSPISFLPLLLASITLRGTITFEREGLPFYFMQDESGTNWRIERRVEDPALHVGDAALVQGEPEPSSKRRLRTTRLSPLPATPSSPLPPLPPPKAIGIESIFANIMPHGNGDWYGARLVTEGLLRDINRRQSTTQLLVGEGENNLQIEIPWAVEDALPQTLVLGATVRVTGVLVWTSIENYDEGVAMRIENVELLPLSGDAVEVIRRAPFWTVRRLMLLIGGFAALFLVVSVWAITLRRMVAKRTAELGESIRARETERIEADAARRERLRLAADLHDGFQQYLAGAMFRLKAAINYLPKDDAAANCRLQLEKVKDALQHTQAGLRSTLWAMNEESEGPESLLALFTFTARRMAHWEGRVQITSGGEERPVARRSAGTLLLIMQEAVGNALRHGEARNVRVRLAFAEKELTMTVVDDGRGFAVAPNTDAGHYGMASMERRTNELGGTMTVWSRIGLGSKLAFTIPY